MGDHHDVKINAAGDGTFVTGYHCYWTTLSGRDSTIIITNPGENLLTFSVTGAPDEIEAEGPDGRRKFNGSWTIKPKQQTLRVLASHDFKGVTVTITNQSDPDTDCKVVTTV